MRSSVMVTGGAGYIGSHAVLRLLRDDRHVVVVDNLSRGHRRTLDLVRAATPRGRLEFVEAGVDDRAAVGAALRRFGVKDLLHFAAFAVVPESVSEPLAYFRNNTAASITLIEACLDADVERFIFSSTAAVYGVPSPSEIPIREDVAPRPINPYGRSKLAVEWTLADVVHAGRKSGRGFAAASLRYFNVAGCDQSGAIGEHHEPETHLIPIVIQHLLGQRQQVMVFGDDYDTPDGTCIRDYIHVEDLIDAHVAALDALTPGEFRTYNLGVGRGYSVREIIQAAEAVTGCRCVVSAGPRRRGDPPVLLTDPSRIQQELGWAPRITSVEQIVETAWRWFSANPNRYATQMPTETPS